MRIKMKIIKMGNLSIARNICPYCDCEYEYNDADIYTGYESVSQYAYVICPCCGQINRINTLLPNKYYPPFSPTVTFDRGHHIPAIDTMYNQQDCLHESWNSDLKEDDKNGDM